MMEIQTEIEIGAPPGRVWEILTDFDAYPGWNPFIVEAEGEPLAGARLRVRIAPPGRKPMEFTPVVLRADERIELRWRGRLGMAWIFEGEHVFRLRPRADGGTRFEHSERFRGLLTRFFPASMWRATRMGFEAMNEALKSRAQASRTT
jgi:hypothetical protein